MFMSTRSFYHAGLILLKNSMKENVEMSIVTKGGLFTDLLFQIVIVIAIFFSKNPKDYYGTNSFFVLLNRTTHLFLTAVLRQRVLI